SRAKQRPARTPVLCDFDRKRQRRGASWLNLVDQQRHGGRSRDQAQIDQKTGLWQGRLSFAPQAGPACLVAGQTTGGCASSLPSTPGATLSQRQVLGDMKLRYGLAPVRECGLSFSLSSVYNAFS